VRRDLAAHRSGAEHCRRTDGSSCCHGVRTPLRNRSSTGSASLSSE
jgi:hypothetical protein